MLDILIHTYGRPMKHLQYTLAALDADEISHYLVVQEREADQYHWFSLEHPGHLIVLPDSVRYLADTRDWIIHDMVSPNDHVVFLDDDLDFAVRRREDPTKFRQPERGDLKSMFHEIDQQLYSFPMVGVGAREGGNRNTEEYMDNTRIMRVLAFRRSYLQERKIYFTPLVVMEDFHVNLQILRSGGNTRLCNNWVSNQRGGSDAPGGCSTYRTPAIQTASAKLLAFKHPGFVRVVQKETKGAWGGGTRTDVVVSWKQARKSAGQE